jgi:HK97 family phage prohead protease
MPYDVLQGVEGCSGWAVVKTEDDEIMGCHSSKAEAEDQLTALNIAEYGENSYHTKKPRDPKPGYGKRAPAPKKDQIVGSDENKPGSAAGKKGEIEISATTEKALQNKVDDHNEAMEKRDRPSWTRVTLGALKSVYRRGAGAYSTSHRPGIGRAQWAMARVNAFLYLSRTGRPENADYKTDFDLLNKDHPKYSEAKRSDEPRAADSYPPTDGMVEEAQRGLDWRSEFGRGGTAIGIARARDIVNRKELPINTWRRVKAFFDRHEVDKKAEGFRPGEDGFPSNGRIAWALWGGDAGYSRAKAIMEDFNNDERSVMDEIRGIDGIYPVTPLQNHLYEVLEETVDVFGQFEQGIGAQGAHYVGPEDNPFASEGMVCSNCAFYEGPRACEIVSGDIDPAGICKFWVIPESLLTIEDPAELIVEEEPMMEMESARSTETRSDLYRNVPFEFRAAEDTGDGLTLTGYAAVFNRSTMIDNYEGRFEERIRPGAFKRSINAKMPVLQFEHGRHPLLGSMPLGQITKLREDEHGLYVEARLADNWLIQPVRDAIASGSIDGMSFRFQVVRDSVDESGDTPVRTLEEVKLLELGPVVFPAYAETSVGVRSADLSPLFSLPQDDRQAIARALVLGTQPEPASNGTSERPADSDQDSQQHSGLSPHQRSAQLRTIEGVL